MPPKPPKDKDRLDLQKWTGGRVKAARNDMGLNQVELAELLGFRGSWLSAVENGQNSIDAHDLQKLASTLKYPVEYFTDRSFKPRLLKEPQTRLDWEASFPNDPDRADAHWQIDRILRTIRERREA